MRLLIQKVKNAKVLVSGLEVGKISKGLLVFQAVEDIDNQKDIDWLVNKIINLRIFNDSNGVMNISVKEAGGDILVVSQFTLMASIKKGNRPSYARASDKNYEKIMLLGDKSIRPEEKLTRLYPQKNLFSHIIGQIDDDNKIYRNS